MREAALVIVRGEVCRNILRGKRFTKGSIGQQMWIFENVYANFVRPLAYKLQCDVHVKVDVFTHHGRAFVDALQGVAPFGGCLRDVRVRRAPDKPITNGVLQTLRWSSARQYAHVAIMRADMAFATVARIIARRCARRSTCVRPHAISRLNDNGPLNDTFFWIPTRAAYELFVKALNANVEANFHLHFLSRYVSFATLIPYATRPNNSSLCIIVRGPNLGKAYDLVCDTNEGAEQPGTVEQHHANASATA